jgi:hypothetical protein
MRGLHAADNEQIKNQNHNPLTLALSPRGERGQSQSIAGSRDESHSAIRTVQFEQRLNPTARCGNYSADVPSWTS